MTDQQQTITDLRARLDNMKEQLATTERIQEMQSTLINRLTEKSADTDEAKRYRIRNQMRLKVPTNLDESLKERYLIATDIFERIGGAYQALQGEAPDTEFALEQLMEGLRLSETWINGFSVAAENTANLKWKIPQLYYGLTRNMALQEDPKWDFSCLKFKADADKAAAAVKIADRGAPTTVSYNNSGPSNLKSAGPNNFGNGAKRFPSGYQNSSGNRGPQPRFYEDQQPGRFQQNGQSERPSGQRDTYNDPYFGTSGRYPAGRRNGNGQF